MIYKAKEGSKAYEYIKSICEAEDKEFKAYVNRVEEAVGFELDKFGGYIPVSTITRICKVTSILVDKEKWEQLDKKLWKKKEVIKDYVRINRITLPQLRYTNGHCFIRLGDNVRADKENPDLVEITMSEYERLIEKE